MLTTSADQNASKLGPCGGVGIRFFLEGDIRRDLLGLAGGGGVHGRSICCGSLWGDLLRGGELKFEISMFELDIGLLIALTIST